MARPLDLIHILECKDVEATFQELTAPPESDPHREALLREALAYVEKHPVRTREQRIREKGTPR
jgi:hypothetical protein